jgi:stage III sporulation protein AF
LAAFFDYLKNITYYLLFSTLAGMAAPSGKYKKYVALITGLVLLLLMVSPLKEIAGRGVPVTEWFALTPPDDGIAPQPAYSQWSSGQLGEIFEEQLYAQVAALLSDEGYTLIAASFEYEEDFTRINGMSLTVSAKPGVKANKPFIYIEPVTIGPPGTADNKPEDEDTKRIKKIVTDFYAPDTPHINVILE